MSENYLKKKLEALPAIGKGNVDVSVWPGRWLIEFVGDLAGSTFDLFVVDREYAAAFEVHVFVTNWNDSRSDTKVIYPIPMYGTYSGDDDNVNDAIAAGSLGIAQWFSGVGFVADVVECREYNGDGNPDL